MTNIWKSYEYAMNTFTGFSWVFISQCFVVKSSFTCRKKNIFCIFFPYLLRPLRRILQSGCRTGSEVRAPRALPTDPSTLLAPLRLLLHHSAWSERDEIFSPHLQGSFWPVWPILSEGRLPRLIQKKLLPVSASMGRATGSTWSWFRTFCRDESTSQSTVRAFWTAFMQIVCRCLTGVFSLSVDDRSGLMTSRHSCAAPLGWERMGCHRCRRVPFSNKPEVVDPRLRESNFFAIFGEIAVFAR